MFDRPIAAFDIETVPDPDFGRRVLHLDGDDEAVMRRMMALRLEETDGRTEYPQPPVHRIVAICVAWLDPQQRRFNVIALGDGASDEVSQLEAFAALLEAPTAPRLVSWNGNGFDLPVIRYRSMLHRVAIPALHRTDAEWKWNNYANRFHTMHVDLMDVLSGYGGSSRVGLSLLGDLLGFPNKAFIEGPVYEHILRGEEERVREYCKLDVVTTLLAFLRWGVLRGDVDACAEADCVSVIREGLEAQSYAGWADIAAALAAPRARESAALGLGPTEHRPDSLGA